MTIEPTAAGEPWTSEVTWVQLVHGELDDETTERLRPVRAAADALHPLRVVGRDDRVAWAYSEYVDYTPLIAAIEQQREAHWRVEHSAAQITGAYACCVSPFGPPCGHIRGLDDTPPERGQVVR